jgi:uncharacterized protein YqeY
MSDATLKSRVQEDMKLALKAKESERLGTIRMLLAAIKQREIDERVVLTDAEILTVVNKMIKQRKESAEQFTSANRPELAEKEKREIEVLKTYLPTQMTDTQIDAAVSAAIQETGAKGLQDIGKVMALIKSRVEGQADMSTVSVKVKAHLSN